MIERLSDEQLQDACDAIRPGIEALSSDTPVATVGFPAYNEEDYLLPGLQSLAALKTQIPLRFIAANNNSTDRTGEILQACGVTVVDEPEKGTSYARQALIKATEGDFLLQTDADTQVPQTWVNAHLQHYENPSIVGVCGKFTAQDFHPVWKAYKKTNQAAHFVLNKIHGHERAFFVAGSNFSARLEALESVGGYEPGYNKGEDTIIAQKLSQLGVYFVDGSEEIKVNTNGRRMATFEQVMTHFRKRIFEKDFWAAMAIGRVGAPVEKRGFEDIR